MVVVWKVLAPPFLISEPLPNAPNSSYLLRLDSMLRELRKLPCYDKHGCFSWENVFGPPQKPWLWTEKKIQKALALLGSASGPLPNAVNSSVVPTESAAFNQKTTEYSFELLLSNYRYLIFFLRF